MNTPDIAEISKVMYATFSRKRESRAIEVDVDKASAFFGVDPCRDDDCEFYGVLLGEAMKQLGADSAFLVLADSDGELGRKAFCCSGEDEAIEKEFNPPECGRPFISALVNLVWSNRGAVLTTMKRQDARTSFEQYREAFGRPEVSNIDEICVSLFAGSGDRLGLLVFGRAITPNRTPFAFRNVVLAETLGFLMSVVIESCREADSDDGAAA